MIKLINCLTDTEMWVADDRVDEYLEAGHKPVSDSIEKKPAEKQSVKPKKPVKRK